MMKGRSPRIRFRDDWQEEPAEVFSRMRHQPGAFFLDSGEGTTGAHSLLGCCPTEELRGSLWDPASLREAVGLWPEASPGDPFPLGGYFGHVTYEGDYHFGAYPHLLVFIHRERRWLEIGETSSWFLPARPTFCELGDWDFQPVITRSQFLERVCRAQESIAQGDIYQVNVAQPFRVRAPEGGLLGDPWSFYERLRHHSPAPFSAFFRREETTIVSSSPEEFLHISGRGVRTQPIKGTRPRFRDERRDAASAAELVASSKERAELLMITDLLRNDLGQFCEYGSVSVEKLLDLQAFRHIYHLVSEVRGTMRQGVHPVDVLRLCFPGGSITGAPKRRACEIIREIEGEDRGVYTGAIGYFGFNGVAHFSIAIRTATMQPDWAEFRVGAGIVADSSPVMEYEETLHKAAGMLAAAHDIHRVGDKYPLLQSMSIAS